MDRLKVLSVFGTRPEAIKMAPLIKELKKDGAIEPLLCVTAQHRSMLDMVLDIFEIKPDADLNIMQEGQSLSDITRRSLSGLDDVLKKLEPHIILVHGDTTTTFSAALSGFYAKIPVGHVEAGLRTYDKYQPYPEEINRRLVSAIADLNFAPTNQSKDNLLRENIDAESIFVTGNTAIDCLKTTVDKGRPFAAKELSGIDFSGRRVITLTAHRRENIGEPLENICQAANDITAAFPDVLVVYPVHPNPQVLNTARAVLGGNPRVFLVPPLDILDMHNLIDRSFLVMTDSGGLQEEAPSLDKPVLVLRNVTERPEGVLAGALKIAGVNRKNIFSEAALLLTDTEEYKKMARAQNPFGDGLASRRIVSAIKYHFNLINDRPADFNT